MIIVEPMISSVLILDLIVDVVRRTTALVEKTVDHHLDHPRCPDYCYRYSCPGCERDTHSPYRTVAPMLCLRTTDRWPDSIRSTTLDIEVELVRVQAWRTIAGQMLRMPRVCDRMRMTSFRVRRPRLAMDWKEEGLAAIDGPRNWLIPQEWMICVRFAAMATTLMMLTRSTPERQIFSAADGPASAQVFHCRPCSTCLEKKIKASPTIPYVSAFVKCEGRCVMRESTSETSDPPFYRSRFQLK